MAKIKKKATNIRKTKKSQPASKTPEIVSICLAALAIILFVCVYTTGEGWLVSYVSSVMRGLFGIGAYIIPLGLIGVVVYYFASKDEDKRKKYVLSAVTLLDVIAFCHMIFAIDVKLEKIYHHNLVHLGGGVIGAVIAKPLQGFMGNACTYVVLCAVFAIMLVLIFNVSFTVLLKSIFSNTQRTVCSPKRSVSVSSFIVVSRIPALAPPIPARYARAMS